MKGSKVVDDYDIVFLPLIICGTVFLTLLMLPAYFIRKKKKPNDEKNTIIRLIVLSFLAQCYDMA